MTEILTENPIWFEGNAINEVAFCKAFLQNRPLRCVNGRFYDTDGAVDDSTISYEISTMLTAHVSYGIAKKVQALTAALKLFLDGISMDSVIQFRDFSVQIPVERQSTILVIFQSIIVFDDIQLEFW